MVDFSFFDTPGKDIQTPRLAPAGEYIAVVSNYHIADKANDKGSVRVALEFKLQQPIQGQDLTGVNLNKAYFFTTWASPNSMGYVKRDMQKLIGEEAVNSGTPRDWFQSAVGRPAKVTLRVDDYKAKQGKDDMEVASFIAA